MKPGNIRLVGLALGLMLLGSLVLLINPHPRYYAPRELSPHTHSLSFNVSLDDAEWNLPVEPLFYFDQPTRIGITDMETNETPVGLAIQNRNNETVFALSSVIQITNSSLAVPASEDFKIIVIRETGDANGSLTILIWEIMPPPAIDPVVIGYFTLPFTLAILALIVIWKIAKTETTSQSVRPGWIVVLVVIGLVLAFPYISGAIGGFFTPTDVREKVHFDRRTLVLNGTNPNGVVPFGNEIPNNTESFRLHSFDDDKKYHFELIGAHDEVVLSATHENSSVAWEILGDFESQEQSLRLNRVDTDVDVSLSMEVTTATEIVPVDPLPNLTLAVGGLIALVLAIVASLSVQPRERVRQN
ncbi:MAG: hypothetical protein ACXADC_07700 [Candidatus Thorarchaeota archaeon]